MKKASEDFNEQLTRKKMKQKKELTDIFNDITYDLIFEFMGKTNTGEVKLENTSDLMRLFQIWLEVNDIKSLKQQALTGTGTGGSLPPIPSLEKGIMGDNIKTKTEMLGNEPVEYVDNEELSSMTVEEMAKFLEERSKAMNQSNEGLGVDED